MFAWAHPGAVATHRRAVVGRLASSEKAERANQHDREAIASVRHARRIDRKASPRNAETAPWSNRMGNPYETTGEE